MEAFKKRHADNAAKKELNKMYDEVKDKMFELELSWVGEFTDGVHKRVPEDVSLNVKYYMSSRSYLNLCSGATERREVRQVCP